MGKKRFIDKKRSTTYHLVYRSTEDADDVPERVLVEADRYGAAGPWRADAGGTSSAADEAASGRRYPPGHPLSWLEEEEQALPMSEARRRELIELGFPGEAGPACSVFDKGKGCRWLHGVGTGRAVDREAWSAVPSTLCPNSARAGLHAAL